MIILVKLLRVRLQTQCHQQRLWGYSWPCQQQSRWEIDVFSTAVRGPSTARRRRRMHTDLILESNSENNIRDEKVNHNNYDGMNNMSAS